MEPKIRVLIVDDSASVRETLKLVLESDPQIQVIATAADPYIATRHIAEEVPDVITLDVEMPRMDGLTFLEKIMSQHPLPVIMCSSLTTAGSELALAALERGAVDIIEKPKVGTRQYLEESRILICDAVKAAASTKIAQGHNPLLTGLYRHKLPADVILPKPSLGVQHEATEKVIVVGASTGGTEALRIFLEALPANAPGVVIAQHMPERFTACFAKRLDALCHIAVREAQNNDPVLPGMALIAPGGKHVLLKRSGGRYFVELSSGPLVSRHRPSVNVLFRSAARYGGRNVIGVIMTGMGDDGATGMRELKEAGAFTIAQDEASCIVFGMPQEAIKLGGVELVLPLDQIAAEVVRRGKSSH